MTTESESADQLGWDLDERDRFMDEWDGSEPECEVVVEADG